MNQKDFDDVVQQTIGNIQKLLVVKGGEYAGSDDRLANFKRGANLTGCTPLQVLFIYLSKHYDGIASYVKTSAAGATRPSSEPIEGRFDDLINYCILAKALVAEADAAKQSLGNFPFDGYRFRNQPAHADTPVPPAGDKDFPAD